MQSRSMMNKTLFRTMGTVGGAENPENALNETEGLILLIIRSYFLLQWSRHYKKFDEHNLMSRLQYTIMMAIEREKLPRELNLIYFVPARMMVSHQPIPRRYLEAHVAAVGEYLQEKQLNPAPARYREHSKRLRRRLGLEHQ